MTAKGDGLAGNFQPFILAPDLCHSITAPWRLYVFMPLRISIFMRIITLVTQKGGTGKSTIATNLAIAAMQAGETVVAIDLDAQATLAGWAEIRRQPTPAVAKLPVHESARLPQLLQAASNQYSVAIIDTPGVDSPLTHNAMSAAQLCLVPLRPTRPDGLAVAPTVQALLVGKRRFAFVLNQCPTTARNTRAGEMQAGLGQLGVCAEPIIALRTDYQDAFAAGKGVTEYAPDGKAAEEIRRLWTWIDETTAKDATTPLTRAYATA